MSPASRLINKPIYTGGYTCYNITGRFLSSIVQTVADRRRTKQRFAEVVANNTIPSPRLGPPSLGRQIDETQSLLDICLTLYLYLEFPDYFNGFIVEYRAAKEAQNRRFLLLSNLKLLFCCIKSRLSGVCELLK